MVDKLQRKLSRMEAKAVAVTEEQAQVIASLQQQVATSSQSPVNKIKEMPEVAKYFKLLSMGLPPDQVKMKMQLAGVDPNLLDTPDAPSAKLADDQGAGAAISPTAPAPAPEVPPEYVKYFKLLKMGMPLEQVKLKASADGFDPSKLDNPPPPLASAPTPEDPPEIAKYKKLLKMGMPLAQVQLKMQAEGLNPALLDGGNTTPSNSNSNSNSNGGPAAKLDLNQLLKKTSSMKKDETASAALPKKDSVKPNVDMRALFWTRIPVNVVQSTVWSSLSDTSVSLEPFDLEWMFRKANPASTVDKDSNEKKKKDSAAVLLLDSKTQQNVGIALARFKLSPSDVKAGLLAMDQTAISVDHLSSLIALAPTLEEQDLLKNYDGPVHVLGAVEKFFLEMLSIPRYTQRIKCFRIKLFVQYTLYFSVLVLAIGNYMNGGTARGGAYGFKLDALAKLHTVRGIDSKVTLMHYLARHLEQFQPDLIAFVKEVPHVTEAKRLSLDQIKADINVCNSELAMLQGQVHASKNTADAADQFYAKMAPFAQEAADVMDDVTKEFGAVEAAFTDLVGSFGEDARKFGAMDFFTILDEFTTELK
ncbi:hypothetical protein DYB34_003871, partial [Aphanomyces astaci]